MVLHLRADAGEIEASPADGEIGGVVVDELDRGAVQRPAPAQAQHDDRALGSADSRQGVLELGCRREEEAAVDVQNGDAGVRERPRTGRLSGAPRILKRHRQDEDEGDRHCAVAMAKSLRRDRISRRMSATVARPTRVVGRSILPACATRSAALSTLFAYALSKPVRAISCPSTICTVTPAMKPTITAFETKRVRAGPAGPEGSRGAFAFRRKRGRHPGPSSAGSRPPRAA